MRASSFALHRTLLVSILTLQLLLCAPLLAQPSGISGSWYDPERSGEGFVIQVIGAHEALVVWFTYDLTGEQRWYIGQGSFDGTSILIDQLLVTEGGRFGSALDPSTITRIPTGSLGLHFTSCTEATAEYQVGDITGQLNLTRLSIPAAIPCGEPVPATELSGLGGTWFDVDRSGEGLLLEVLDEQRLLAYWFSYTVDGQALWLMGIGTRQDQFWQFDRVFGARGGVFGPGFDPSAVELVDFGQAQLALDCSTGIWRYSADAAEYGSGVHVLTRLAAIDQLDCRITLPDRVAQDQTVAYTNALVRNFNGADPAEPQSVLVEQGTITAIGPSRSTELPVNALRLNLQGGYLMPGLTDLHTHIGTSPTELLGQNAAGVQAMVEEAATGELLVYLSQGVTTVLNAGDFGEPLPRWSAEIDRGDKVGPKLYSAKYTRGPPGTPDGGPEFSYATQSTARSHVAGADNAGYDMIKIYNYTPANALPLIFEEAGSRQMAVIGHFPQTEDGVTTLDRGLAAVAHGQAYFWRWGYSSFGATQALNASLRNDTSIIATLAHMEIIADIWGFNLPAIQEYRARPELRYLHPTSRSLNNRGIIGSRWNPSGASPGGLDPSNDYIASYLRRYFQAGVPFLLGSDSPTVLGVPGFSAHEEMRVMRERLQISDTEVLAIATRNGGRFINRWIVGSESFGQIALGQRADMLALVGDPRNDLSAVQQRLGVVAQGRWYGDAWLQSEIEALAQRYAGQEVEAGNEFDQPLIHGGSSDPCLSLSVQDQ